MRAALLTLLAMAASTTMAAVRPAAVAGAFYPGDPAELRQQVVRLLEESESQPSPAVAVVVPHAGYVFSGTTAASAIRALDGEKLRRIILLGPSHHVAFAGGALPAENVTAFATPLGEVAVDRKALATLRSCPELVGPASAHNPEHCLEVELPFLQVVAPEAEIVPILLGYRTDRETCARIARCLAGLVGPGTAVVASTDFTHHGRGYGYAPFAGAADLADRLLGLARVTAGRAAAVDPRGFWQQVEVSGDTVCGVRPVSVLVELLDHAFEGSGKLVGLTSSGHLTRQWDQVVTYAAATFSGAWQGWKEDGTPPSLETLKPEQREAILRLARATLRSHLIHDESLARWFEDHPGGERVLAPAGAFVTVNNRGARAQRHGKLRACMGVIEARAPLVDAVIHAAVTAAHDPRFPPLEATELAGVSLEVSVLSPTRQVSGPEAIVVGTHGVVLSKQGRSAVFLPQVAPEQGWDRDTMLDHLATKAGLAADAWRHGATFEVFTAQVIAEEE